jgi:hypothetical protein
MQQAEGRFVLAAEQCKRAAGAQAEVGLVLASAIADHPWTEA